jgi:hypothetical protein
MSRPSLSIRRLASSNGLDLGLIARALRRLKDLTLFSPPGSKDPYTIHLSSNPSAYGPVSSKEKSTIQAGAGRSFEFNVSETHASFNESEKIEHIEEWDMY